MHRDGGGRTPNHAAIGRWAAPAPPPRAVSRRPQPKPAGRARVYIGEMPRRLRLDRGDGRAGPSGCGSSRQPTGPTAALDEEFTLAPGERVDRRHVDQRAVRSRRRRLALPRRRDLHPRRRCRGPHQGGDNGRARLRAPHRHDGAGAPRRADHRAGRACRRTRSAPDRSRPATTAPRCASRAARTAAGAALAPARARPRWPAPRAAAPTCAGTGPARRRAPAAARLHGVEARGAVGAHRGEAAVAQHLQVLRHRRLGDAELALDDLDEAARRRLAVGQQLEDAAAHRVARGRRRRASAIRRIAAPV